MNIKDENIIEKNNKNRQSFEKYQDRITTDENGREIIKENFKLYVEKEGFDELLFEMLDYFVSLQAQ